METEEASFRDIIHRFESLGHNCEFAFVQQAYGFEEGSLLQWAYIHTVDNLVSAIDRKFKGLFKFENLVPLFGETMVEDITFGIGFHSKIRAAAVDGEFIFNTPESERREIHAVEIEKIRFLTSKLLASFAAAKRIWVFKHRDGVTRQQAGAIHSALRNFGPNRLLVVVEAKDPRQAGSIEVVEAGLYFAQIARYSDYAKVHEFDRVSWREILTKVAAKDLELETS